MQLTQKLGAYGTGGSRKHLFDGRNCTVHEFFPRLAVSFERKLEIAHREQVLQALWKSCNEWLQAEESFKTERCAFGLG